MLGLFAVSDLLQCNTSDETGDENCTKESEEGDEAVHEEFSKPPLLYQAICKYQLCYFMLANILTGLVNKSVDTLDCGVVFSLCVLVCYLTVLNGVVYLSYIYI